MSTVEKCLRRAQVTYNGDNAFPIPFSVILLLSHTRVCTHVLFRFLIQVSTVRFPRPYSKCKEQKEGARAQRSHAAQIEAAG